MFQKCFFLPKYRRSKLPGRLKASSFGCRASRPFGSSAGTTSITNTYTTIIMGVIIINEAPEDGAAEEKVAAREE